MFAVEEKLNFAVFIDFDNIEIGVKSTLSRAFDVQCVLEGIKERGEISAKVAYGNWSRQASETRALTENGVQMVQRDTTPRGDKNGADINLALDALEMAFTRDHINAFAIVSGDSDFMALVNKLKQYNKRVYIVGGKAFTSTILQRNCHEFISYESLLEDHPPRSRRGAASGQRGRQRRSLPLSQAVALINRALQALDRRGAQPQLGLLKSTVLQLDSAFTERDYGVSSFSGLVEKMVAQGTLKLITVDGHHVVERKSEDVEDSSASPDDAISVLSEVLEANLNLLEMGVPARELGALVKAVDPDFNETDYGFHEFAELLNFAQDKGLVRAETSSEHGMLFYAGDDLIHRISTGMIPAAAESKAASVAAGAKSGTRRPAKRAAKGRSRTRARRRTVTREAAKAPEAERPTPDGEETGEQVPSADTSRPEPSGTDQEPQLATGDSESSTPPEKQTRGRRVGSARSRSSTRGTVRRKPVTQPPPESD